MVAVTKIRFRDLDERERAERSRIAKRVIQLLQIKKDRKQLSADETAEQDRLEAIQSTIRSHPTELCDPLFVGIRDLFNETPGLLDARLKNHVRGVLEGTRIDRKAGDLTNEAVVRTALTIGLAIVDGVTAPSVRVRKLRAKSGAPEPKAAQPAALQHEALQPYIETDEALDDVAAKEGDSDDFRIVSRTSDHAKFSALSSAFFTALGKAQSMQTLALLVLPLLAQEGDPRGTDDAFPGAVDAEEFARVMTALVARGVIPREGQQLRRSVNQCLDEIQHVGESRVTSELGIDFGILEESGTSDAVEQNVRLYGTMICAAMFDELKVFQVVDKLAELFQQGMLPIGSGDAGRLLYKYWKEAPNRMSEGERKNFYAITMGIPGGDTTQMVNREFNDVWLRFVSSATSFVRQSEVDKLLRSGMPNAVSHQQLRKAARDLVTNLSAHGYGMAYFAAVDLQDQITFMMKLLSDADVRGSYGARDPWQVVDQVATLELGGARTSTRYRTLASCGATITAWLANNLTRIMRPSGPIIDIDDVRSSLPRSSGQATKNPTDYDLINACELWLADTAVSDTRVDEMAQPRESPVMTSKPVQIPSIARDMLEGAGVGLGMEMGNGAGHGSGRLHLNP